MLTYYNCRVFNELNFYSLSLFSTCFYSIFLYFSFKFHKITVKSGVDLSHGANWTRIVTSYFSVDAYSHLFFFKNQFLNWKIIQARLMHRSIAIFLLNKPMDLFPSIFLNIGFSVILYTHILYAYINRSVWRY